jgi:hypothetical protein
MKECDKRNPHISSKLHMIYISSNNVWLFRFNIELKGPDVTMYTEIFVFCRRTFTWLLSTQRTPGVGTTLGMSQMTEKLLTHPENQFTCQNTSVLVQILSSEKNVVQVHSNTSIRSHDF